MPFVTNPIGGKASSIGSWLQEEHSSWEWKKNGDNDYYIEHYNAKLLSKFDPHKLLNISMR